MKTFLNKLCLTLAALTLVVGITAQAKDMTAFELAKEGNRFIGEQSKDQVVEIRSDKSVASMVPDVWYVVYYDPDATLKATEVKFGAGKKMDVKRPARILEQVTGGQDPLVKDKLKVDSDEALKIASAEPLAAKLTLKASKMTLQRRSKEDGEPVWKVRLWAARLANANEDADIGEVVLSAADGKVLKSDLKPERVD